ncbi:MAG TPA: MotA/TolQ/ExbB proton channel family protein [Gammaproteobacteria bacterium]|nr:MotA/TolQ/ExbB proton channel family protein [Gammaproteobacteria bacterium]
MSTSKSRIFAVLAASALIGALPLAGFGQQQAGNTAAAPASSKEALLERVRSIHQGENELYKQRAAKFNAAPKIQQEQMLRDAQQKLAQLSAASTKMADTYAATEIKINELHHDLTEKAQDLGLAELFGLARQVAGDAAGILHQSLINSQFKATEGKLDRVAFLRDFADGRQTPTPEELEQLWFEIHREMTAQGEVLRYQAEVVQPDGMAESVDVVRIGPFVALSDEQFLSYMPDLGSLTVLPRQLPDEFMDIAEDFYDASEEYVPAVIDYTRGVLQALYIERPTWIERIHLGQEIGYIIILVGLAGAFLFVYQLLHLIQVRTAVKQQLDNLDEPRDDNPLGRVLLAFRGDPNRIEEDADVAELRISEAVLREVPTLERFQHFLRVAVAAGPLLGLIGTVVGMIFTFQSITESGSGDPRLMATGIGQAMIATVLGLGIAIPLLFANALLSGLSRSVVQILDEQSAGMLAESIEKRRNA